MATKKEEEKKLSNNGNNIVDSTAQQPTAQTPAPQAGVVNEDAVRNAVMNPMSKDQKVLRSIMNPQTPETRVKAAVMNQSNEDLANNTGQKIINQDELDKEYARGDGGSAKPKNAGSVAGSTVTVKDLDDLMGMLNDSYQLKSKEEIEAARRRERRNSVMRAIGDGIGALSNLYFTTKGAPNAEQGKMLTEEGEKNFKKRLDEWNADRKEYLSNRLRLLEAQVRLERALKESKNSTERANAYAQYYRDKAALDREKSDRDFKYKQEQDKKEEERKKKDDERKDKDLESKMHSRDVQNRTAQQRAANNTRDTDNRIANRNRNGGSGGGRPIQERTTVNTYGPNGEQISHTYAGAPRELKELPKKK